MMVRDLSEIREEIDRLDKEIVSCYEQRMDLVRQVAAYKIATGKQVLDSSREKQKLETLGGLAKNDFDRQAVQEIFTQLMAISRKSQYQMLAAKGMSTPLPCTLTDKLVDGPVRVVFQGVEGAYGHAAMLQYFGEEVDSYHVKQFRDVMEEVAAGRADFGVLPIENSSAGMVSDVYDLLVEYQNVIAAETDLKVQHALLGLPGATVEDIRTVYSHPQGLMQCGKFLREHGDWKRISLENTAVSAKRVISDGDKTQAAIASPTAAKLYGLEILAHPVNDNPLNTTRFIIIRKDPIYSKDADKVSICFEIEHTSGSLYNVFSHFTFNHINMTKIEARPVPERPFEYRFYIDVEGSLDSPQMQNALYGIQTEVLKFQILGSYRR